MQFLLCQGATLSGETITIPVKIAEMRAWRVLLPLGGSAASWSLATSTTSCEASDQRKDLLIVGAGKLGSLVGTAWLQAHKADVKVTALTRTESKHEELRRCGGLDLFHR